MSRLNSTGSVHAAPQCVHESGSGVLLWLSCSSFSMRRWNWRNILCRLLEVGAWACGLISFGRSRTLPPGGFLEFEKANLKILHLRGVNRVIENAVGGTNPARHRGSVVGHGAQEGGGGEGRALLQSCHRLREDITPRSGRSPPN